VTTRLFLGCLLSRFGNFACTSLVCLDYALNHTYGNCLAHVTNSEAAEWWVVSEGLDAHGFGRNHLDDGSVTRFDELRVVFNGLAGTTIDLLEELGELAGDVGSVAVEDWSVAGADLTWMVEDDDLGVEGLAALWWVVLGVAGNVATTDLLDGDVLDVEADVVAWLALNKLLVVHLDGLDFGGYTSWGEGDDHTGLDDTSLDTTDWNRADTADLVHILEWETERLVGWTLRWVDGVDGLEEGLAGRLDLGLLLPTLVPWAVGGDVDHVVTVEARDWNEGNRLRVVADLLDEIADFLDDLVEALLGPLGGVHLVDGADELLDTERVGEEGVLTSLAILGDTSFELTSAGSNDEDGAVSLGGTSDHVLDEITMAGGVDDGDIVPGGLELPEGNVDGDTALTLGLELVEHPCVLEGALAQLGGFLLELLDRTLVDATALVDQVSGGRRLAGVDVADDDDVDMSLLLTHGEGCVQ